MKYMVLNNGKNGNVLGYWEIGRIWLLGVRNTMIFSTINNKVVKV
jgi:hypothetical protein